MPTFAAPLTALDRWAPASDGQDPSEDATADVEVVAIKKIVDSDPYLVGHYPDFTVYPGVFIIETVYQGARAYLADGTHPVVTDLEAVDSVRFQAPLLPGDELTARCRIRKEGEGYVVKAKCTRSGGDSAATMTLRLRPRNGASA